MEIWEKRIIGKDGKKESKKSFDKFQLYDKEIPRPRDLYDLATLILYGDKNSKKFEKNREIKRMYSSLNKLYNNYDWDVRSREHDNFITKDIDETLRIEGAMFCLKILKNSGEKIILADTEADRMMKNKTEMVVTKEGLVERPKRDKDQSKSLLENQEMRSIAIKDYFMVMNLGVTKTENKNDNTHTIKENKGIDYFSGLKESESEFNIDDFITED